MDCKFLYILQSIDISHTVLNIEACQCPSVLERNFFLILKDKVLPINYQMLDQEWNMNLSNEAQTYLHRVKLLIQ